MGVPHGRVELLFTMSNGLEKASCSFSTPTLSAASVATLQTMADSVETNFVSHVWSTTIVRQYFPTATKFIGSKVSAVDAGGHTTASAENLVGSPYAGTSADVGLPTEVAVVCSLTTAIAGPRGRGRMYLPGVAANGLQSDGRLTDTVRDALASAMADFLSALNSDTDFGTTVGVASNVGGFWTACDSVKVGGVLDSQRRRRQSLVESYHRVPVV